MKKVLFLIVTFLFSINIVNASNHIYSIDITVDVLENGDANIEEVWTVKGSDGTEWYKALGDLGNSSLSNFTVSMDGTPLTYKSTWNVNGSLESKKGYYGTNKGDEGLELCFGKYDYKKHVFTLNYTLSNFVFNVSDAQAIYYRFIGAGNSIDFDNFTLELSTYYDIPDTLDVWGYGYKGYAYVENGKIKMSNEGDMDGNYIVLLAKFPKETFKNTNSYSKYDTFDSIYKAAEEGSYKYDYNQKMSFFEKVIAVLSFLIQPIIWILVFLGINKGVNGTKYGFINNKTIDKNNTPAFRDIPCNKDIYYANALIQLNKYGKSEASILGAIFLKWIKTGVVTPKKENEKRVSLILNGKSNITDQNEEKLYDMVYTASKDGVLERNELEKWAKKNYSKFLSLFTSIKDRKISELKSQGHIFKRTSKEQCKFGNVMDDTLYEESKKIYGLKLFLEEFSNIKDKEAIEVNLWDEYLMFAYMFGIADKVMKQFKNLYPEVMNEMERYGVDFDTIYVLNNISISSASAASSARAAAQSYSGGGGGFSSGGGGGGSFGGGSFGSR